MNNEQQNKPVAIPISVDGKEEQDGTFEDFMSNSRDAFVKEINEQEWNTKLRTTAEDILICFDQMRERIINPKQRDGDYWKERSDYAETLLAMSGYNPIREKDIKFYNEWLEFKNKKQ